MAKFYFDADVKPDFRHMLRVAGHDVVTTQELGDLAASDAEQLFTSTRLERVIITHNGKDFRTLCQAWRDWRSLWGLPRPDHAGVIAIPQQTLLPYPLAARLIDDLVGREPSLQNQLWFFDLVADRWV